MLHYWYQAAASPLGIVLFTDDSQRLIQKLYAARRDAADESLKALSIVQSPVDPSHIWIVRKDADSSRNGDTPEGNPEPSQG